MASDLQSPRSADISYIRGALSGYLDVCMNDKRVKIGYSLISLFIGVFLLLLDYYKDIPWLSFIGGIFCGLWFVFLRAGKRYEDEYNLVKDKVEQRDIQVADFEVADFYTSTSAIRVGGGVCRTGRSVYYVDGFLSSELGADSELYTFEISASAFELLSSGVSLDLRVILVGHAYYLVFPSCLYKRSRPKHRGIVSNTGE